MGRAIVRDPQVFLFDEPLSNLDAKLRVQMRTEIKALHQRLRTTSVYVTHDQVEAMTMADRSSSCTTASSSRSARRWSSTTIRRNTFVAGFIGSPAMNFIDGHAAPQRRRHRMSRSPTACRCRCRPARRARDGQSGHLRHPARAPRRSPRAADGIDASVLVVEPTGAETLVFAETPGGQMTAVFTERHDFQPGERIALKPRPDCVHLFDAASPAGTSELQRGIRPA